MTAEILSVGTELLLGNIVNTNAQYIAQRLADLGTDCYYQTTVGDNPERLKEALRLAFTRADTVIMTGGLGPTGDDLTKETVAGAFGRKMVLDEPSLEYIKARFARMRYGTMTPNNIKQADFPEGAIILPNPNGTAPGMILESDGKAAILLPGPPFEMKPMFEASVMPYLKEKSGCELYSRSVRVFGRGESSAEYALKDLMESANPTVAPYAAMSEMKLRVTARCRDDAEGEALVTPMIEEIKRRLGDVIYSTNGLELHEECMRLLKEKRLTVALAESLTGGMLASKLVSIPGSSDCFLEACVTYTDEAKHRRLGVKRETLEAHTAVSGETAREMAEGIRTSSGADIGVATTGYAGPKKNEGDKVGLVYVALATKDGTEVKELQLAGDREKIRNLVSLHAFDMLRRYLTK